MNNTYFLNLSSSIKIFGHLIKNIFKKNTERERGFYELSMCLQAGSLEKFEEFFNERYDSRTFLLLIPSAIGNGKLETFLKLEEKAIEFKIINKSFYEIILNSVMSYDNKDVLKHLIINKNFNSFDITTEHIMEASSRNSIRVLEYILYDLKYPINNNLMQHLHHCAKETKNEKHTKTIELIEKRDLLFQLDKELNQTEAIKKPKTNKI